MTNDSVPCLKGIFQTLRPPSPSTLPSNLAFLGPFVKKLLKLTSVAMLMFPLWGVLGKRYAFLHLQDRKSSFAGSEEPEVSTWLGNCGAGHLNWLWVYPSMLLISIPLSQARETILGDSKWEWRSQLLCYLAESSGNVPPQMEQPWTILPSAKQRRFSGDKWENSKTAADNRSGNLNPWLHPSKPPRPHAAPEVSKVLSSAVKII